MTEKRYTTGAFVGLFFNDFNQTDHLFINARHASNIMDVRTFRGANTDHYLLTSKIISQISNARKTYGSHPRKFNSEKLKNPETLSAYRELNENLARCIHIDDINEAWTSLKTAITQTADAALD
jgi:hypothetical protein